MSPGAIIYERGTATASSQRINLQKQAWSFGCHYALWERRPVRALWTLPTTSLNNANEVLVHCQRCPCPLPTTSQDPAYNVAGPCQQHPSTMPTSFVHCRRRPCTVSTSPMNNANEVPVHCQRHPCTLITIFLFTANHVPTTSQDSVYNVP